MNHHGSRQSVLREVKMIFLTCRSSFTLSIGATAVLEIAAATPPAKKSFAKEKAASAMAEIRSIGFSILVS